MLSERSGGDLELHYMKQNEIGIGGCISEEFSSVLDNGIYNTIIVPHR